MFKIECRDSKGHWWLQEGSWNTHEEATARAESLARSLAFEGESLTGRIRVVALV